MELRLAGFPTALTQIISSLIEMWEFHFRGFAEKSADGTFQEFFNSIGGELSFDVLGTNGRNGAGERTRCAGGCAWRLRFFDRRQQAD